MKTRKALVIIFLLIAGIILFKVSPAKQEEKVTVLKSYKNTIALYEGDKRTKVYSEIVLNSLPINDIARLEKGIIITSDEELTDILEDFDG